MLTPDVVVSAAHEATPELLDEHGVRAVLVDVDDTLIGSGSTEIGPDVRNWLRDLRESGLPVVLLSNGERVRVEHCCRELGIEGMHLAGKPFWWAFNRGLRKLGQPAASTAMIGDQLFTDILGANLAGMVSVLVSPLTSGGLPHTKALRRLERLILRGGGHGRTVDR